MEKICRCRKALLSIGAISSLLFVFPVFSFAASARADTGTEALSVEYPDAYELVRKAQERYIRDVKDYEVYFYRQENVTASTFGGKSKNLKKEEKILLRFREVPFSVYMVWVGKVHKGRKVIYKQGWNKNRMKVKLTGLAGLLFGSIDISPNSIHVRKRTRQPITMAGVGNIIRSLVEQFELARKNGDLNNVQYLGIERVAGRDAYKFKRILPPKDGYKYHKLTLSLDKETYFPLKVETVNWSNVVLGKYRFEGFKFNNNFTDRDFDPESNGY